MAYDEGLAQMMRDDLIHLDGITEKKMFGGLCFLLNGNMVCGVHKGGAMFRIGKEREAAAMAIDGARPMDFTGRVMGGFIDVEESAMSNDESRAQWTSMAVDNAATLPPK
ncbi:TfoX/Sxy family protein [Alisedimentitalea sp. MJ-SS2]|uniref:TfoX/Sxy family protein n=1 Tax=Aliisedimentitalea sp. MJ-SS2 TaxID=3049795 RepID=UPI00290D82BB|nr:TfoX/Sxy family protein [Alisedimentitalea sp. MJ-SS2]MDU8926981.1 TfoX/Sxy family protein [Alisedimentitalea sp. MJ-SS2]